MRVGDTLAERLTEQCLPLGIHEAKAIGLIDDVILQDDLGHNPLGRFYEQLKPLESYRRAELAEMKRNFWGDDPSYHLARTAFVRKQPRPAHLKCAVALEAVCRNPGCEQAVPHAANRCALASRGWSEGRPAA